MVPNTDAIRSFLRNHVCLVEFTKADGTLRKMRCTTKEEDVPPKGEGKKAPPQRDESTIVAFDLDISGWRSFKHDRVQYFTVEGS